MYSAVFVTDFDEDYDDDSTSYDSNISYYRSNNNDDNTSNNNVSTLSNSRDTESCRVLKFGEFEENYGWIQCQSKSYPDRVYYYNTRSCCNTWHRPVSRFIDVPVISIRRANGMDDILESTIDLELMSVSDDEEESEIPEAVPAECDRDRALIDVSDVIARYFYSSIDSIPNSPDDSRSSTECLEDRISLMNQEEEEAKASEYFGNWVSPIKQKEKEASEYYDMKEKMDMDNDDTNNNVDDTKMDCSLLYPISLLKTELFTEDEDIKLIDRISYPPLKRTFRHPGRVMYGLPRLKRIGPESQLIKQRRVRKSLEAPGPRKIICDMYGVRTINYNLPELDEVCPVVGVKTSTLSASDSDNDDDANVPPSSSRRTKTTGLLESEWHEIVKNLHQPLLSDKSSSPSSRSDTSSSTNRSTSSSSGSSCSSCSCASCNKKD